MAAGYFQVFYFYEEGVLNHPVGLLIIPQRHMF